MRYTFRKWGFNSSSSPKAAATGRTFKNVRQELGLFQFKQQPESRRYEITTALRSRLLLFQFKQQPESRRYAHRSHRSPDRASCFNSSSSPKAAATRTDSRSLSSLHSFQFKQQPESRRYVGLTDVNPSCPCFNSSSSPKAAATLKPLAVCSSQV